MAVKNTNLKEQLLRQSILDYLRDQGGLPSEDLEVILALLSNTWTSSSTSTSRSLLDIFTSGLDTTVTDSSTTSSVDADLQSETFQKFLEAITAKGFFDGAEIGSESYKKKFQKVVEKFRARTAQASTAHVPVSSSVDAPTPTASVEGEKVAEDYKEAGNTHLKAQKFTDAIESYGKAIEAAGPKGKNLHIYYSNRAAARMQRNKSGDTDEAVKDAQMSVTADPTFSKGYNRLGSALERAGRIAEACSAYERSLDNDPTNTVANDELTRLRSKESQIQQQQQQARSPGSGVKPPSMPNGGGMPSGMPGGMPAGIAEMMAKNPEMANMARDLMSDPSAMAGIAGLMGGGGGGEEVEEEEVEEVVVLEVLEVLQD